MLIMSPGCTQRKYLNGGLCDKAHDELRPQQHCGAFRHIGADDDSDLTIRLCDNNFRQCQKPATAAMPGFA